MAEQGNSTTCHHSQGHPGPGTNNTGATGRNGEGWGGGGEQGNSPPQRGGQGHPGPGQHQAGTQRGGGAARKQPTPARAGKKGGGGTARKIGRKAGHSAARNKRHKKKKDQPHSAKAQDTQGRKPRNAGDTGGGGGTPKGGEGAVWGTHSIENRREGGVKHSTEQTAQGEAPNHIAPRPRAPKAGGCRIKTKGNQNGQMKGEAHQNAPRRQARPTRPGRPDGRNHTHARADPGVVSSDPQVEVSASARNSPGAPADNPVERRKVRETGRVSHRVHGRKTTAAHSARDRRRRDPPRTTYNAEPAQCPRHGGGMQQAP